MQGIEMNVDRGFLQSFEQTLDPRRPQASPIATRILGYGEISTVLQLGEDGDAPYAYKRMPMFESLREVERFEVLYQEYLQLLQVSAEIAVPDNTFLYFPDHRGQWVTGYVVQQKLDPRTVGNRLLHTLDDQDVGRLIRAVLAKIKRLFAFNRANRGELEVGFDGQISNWAVGNLDASGRLPPEIELLYFDTTSPLITRDGQEQLDTELFLRSAPSFMRWLVRAFFLEDVSTRYYDQRKVAIDLLANLIKEQRADLLPDLIGLTNQELAETADSFEAISLDEVRSYYREDAFIWRLYLALRKMDRRLFELRGKPYPYILPDKVQR